MKVLIFVPQYRDVIRAQSVIYYQLCKNLNLVSPREVIEIKKSVEVLPATSTNIEGRYADYCLVHPDITYDVTYGIVKCVSRDYERMIYGEPTEFEGIFLNPSKRFDISRSL